MLRRNVSIGANNGLLVVGWRCGVGWGNELARGRSQVLARNLKLDHVADVYSFRHALELGG